MTNVKTGWNGDDERLATEQGWYVGYGQVASLRMASSVRQHAISPVPKVSAERGWGIDVFVSQEEAVTHVMTQMLAGDALCYKAMRIVCKTNPAYESYKPMVKEVRKKYGW